MGRQQDTNSSLMRYPAKKARRFLRTTRVEAGERLIEEQEPRLGCQSVGYQDSLLLAAGQGPYPGLGEVGGVDGPEKLVHQSALGARPHWDAKPSPIGSELHEVPCTYRQVGVQDYLLGHITDGVPPEMASRYSHLARRFRQEAENCSQQGRLPRTVLPDETGERPCRNRKRHSPEDLVTAQRDREVLDVQRGIFAAGRWRTGRGKPSRAGHQSFTVEVPFRASLRAFISAIIQDW